MSLHVPDSLLRVLMAIAIGGAVTIAIFLVLALLIAGDWVIVPTEP